MFRNEAAKLHASLEGSTQLVLVEGVCFSRFIINQNDDSRMVEFLQNSLYVLGK